MKHRFFSPLVLLFAIVFVASSCSDDDDPVIIDSSMPNGTTTVLRSGGLTAENSTPTAGTVEIIQDEDNTFFLRFGDNFTTELATGTVSVYFSTSSVFMADPGNGNPDLSLVGVVKSNGEQFFKLEGSVSSNFTHVILWCNSASIPFGNAELQ